MSQNQQSQAVTKRKWWRRLHGPCGRREMRLVVQLIARYTFCTFCILY